LSILATCKKFFANFRWDHRHYSIANSYHNYCLEDRYAQKDGLAAGDMLSSKTKGAWVNPEEEMAAQYEDIAKHGIVEVSFGVLICFCVRKFDVILAIPMYC